MNLPKKLGPQEAPSIGPDLYNIMIFRWNCMVKHFLQNELLSDDFPVLVLIPCVGIDHSKKSIKSFLSNFSDHTGIDESTNDTTVLNAFLDWNANSYIFTKSNKGNSGTALELHLLDF